MNPFAPHRDEHRWDRHTAQAGVVGDGGHHQFLLPGCWVSIASAIAVVTLDLDTDQLADLDAAVRQARIWNKRFLRSGKIGPADLERKLARIWKVDGNCMSSRYPRWGRACRLASHGR